MPRFHWLLALGLALAAPAFGDLAPERVGDVAATPERWSDHTFWVSDMLLRRSALFDADSGAMLGSVDAGQDLSPVLPLTSAARREVYVASTYYSRRSHGERTDALVIYDASALAPIADVVLPPKKASNGNGVALGALLDDGRFVVVFNQTPATSVSVVDVAERRFVGEIETAGCALVYPAGARRFGMLCVDGTALTVTLDEQGTEASRAASEKFFDAASDPVTEKGVRLAAGAGRWLFASHEGVAHEIDFAASGGPRETGAWPLFTNAERTEGWRIGGRQHLAFHARSGRLYSLVHRGEADTHKEPGSELWVYDVARRERSGRLDLPNLSASGLRGLLGLEAGGMTGWLLKTLVPNGGADSVLVTSDERPLLLLSHQDAPVIAVLDAASGALLREIEEPGLSIGMLVAP